jgi:CheY-specific phosphatase CheX
MPELAPRASTVAEILMSAAEEVLETMFFTGIIEPAAPPEADGLAALVPFRGAPSGLCGVWLERTAAREMAASFLGLDPEEELGPAQVEQVVCEFANMICGSVVSRLESSATIELDSPRLVPDERFRSEAEGPQCWFQTENGVLGLVLRLEEAA